MRTVTNYFIVNLAVADFLVILFCLPPSVVWDVTITWFFGVAMCKIVLYLQVLDSGVIFNSSTGERVSVGLAAETDGLSKAHTLAVAVFLCGDCGRAVHPKLHTGLLQVLLEHPTQSRNVAL
ncbi:hypothetical protein GEV33_001155 [Tenebrio molitor]|uniref:G-protein coupled receptors family 1 profile domain-containing protein n=1 Tax=Tenebrio molitor TaxID=7067 RepID=A0A8J6HXN6_TENMO|nr:hypothetical protein GEV33_001155 [Tenebrio molitor]